MCLTYGRLQGPAPLLCGLSPGWRQWGSCPHGQLWPVPGSGKRPRCCLYRDRGWGTHGGDVHPPGQVGSPLMGARADLPPSASTSASPANLSHPSPALDLMVHIPTTVPALLAMRGRAPSPKLPPKAPLLADFVPLPSKRLGETSGSVIMQPAGRAVPIHAQHGLNTGQNFLKTAYLTKGLDSLLKNQKMCQL